MSEAVFDSNILIDGLKGIKGAERELVRYKRRFISRVTWIEVLTGAMPDDAQRAEAYMNYFSVIELTEEIARRAATLRSQRKRLALADSVILASAQTSGRILVTRNTRDFPATMPGIRIPYKL